MVAVAAATCRASAFPAASSSTSTRWVRCSSMRGALTSRTPAAPVVSVTSASAVLNSE